MKQNLIRLMSAVLAGSLCMGLAACGEPGSGGGAKEGKQSVKVGLICLHDENSTYDLNFLNAMNEAKKALGLSDDQVIIKKNIPESNECKEAAVDLADRGCDIIFADSFGHEPYLLEAAEA